MSLMKRENRIELLDGAIRDVFDHLPRTGLSDFQDPTEFLQCALCCSGSVDIYPMKTASTECAQADPTPGFSNADAVALLRRREIMRNRPTAFTV